MRALLPLVLLAAACTAPPYEPACVASGDLHTCTDGFPHTCNDMFVMSGLAVQFSGAEAARYDAEVTVDGDVTTLTCADGVVVESRGARVWLCDQDGFLLDAHGDHVEVTVTTDDTTASAEDDPCWDVSEPNGRCCGFHYSATVAVAL